MLRRALGIIEESHTYEGPECSFRFVKKPIYAIRRVAWRHKGQLVGTKSKRVRVGYETVTKYIETV